MQKWRNIPGEEHIGLWEQTVAMSIKAMLQCSFGKYFCDDTAVNNMRRSYEVVCLYLFVPFRFLQISNISICTCFIMVASSYQPYSVGAIDVTPRLPCSMQASSCPLPHVVVTGSSPSSWFLLPVDFTFE